MSIYTRKGDRGETTLFGGRRAPKDLPRLEVCGDLDELDSLLGLARCESLPEDVAELLEDLQRRMTAVRLGLFDSNTASSESGKSDRLDASDVEGLERAIDRYDAVLPPLRKFIIPGGCRAAAVLHVARTVCRRAERRLVSLARAEPQSIPPPLLAYLNRLGDLLFVLARSANARAGIEERPY